MELDSQDNDARVLPDIAEVNPDGHNAEDQDSYDTSLLTQSFKIQLTGKLQSLVKTEYSSCPI